MSLPFDIYIQILAHLPPSRRPHDDASVKALVACLQSSSLLYQAASSPIIWEAHYRERYTHPPIPPTLRDWKSCYYERRRRDYQILRHLDDLVTKVTQWDDFWLTCGPFTFDCWDVLELEVQYHVSDALRDDGRDSGPIDQPRSLTRRYWAQGLLRTIARVHAIKRWDQLLSSPESVSFEESHSTLSVFWGESPHKITSQIEDLAMQCRAYVESTRPTISASSSAETLQETCIQICRFMHEQGFGPAEGREFPLIMNNFPHAYLSTHKKTIPISLVHVFVSVAQRLGVKASPVNFPGKVLARVHTSSEEGFYVDVYSSKSKAILSEANDIQGVSLPLGLQDLNLSRLSCTGVDMLIRASRNIYNSSQNSDDYTISAQHAVDTASCVALAMTGEPGLVHFLLQEGSFISALDSSITLPSLAEVVRVENTRQLLRSASQQAQDVYIKARSKVLLRSSHPKVKHFVGMFFIHAKYQYNGCIIGWEPTCTASHQWIERNGVARLKRGQHQPFYISIAISNLSSGWSQTFVAEENILPVPPSAEFISQLLRSYREFGMYFEDISLPADSQHSLSYRRMLLSPQLRQMYPEDDAFGASWIVGMNQGEVSLQ